MHNSSIGGTGGKIGKEPPFEANKKRPKEGGWGSDNVGETRDSNFLVGVNPGKDEG